MTANRCLLVDDNPDDRALVERQIARQLPMLEIVHVGDADRLAAALDGGEPALVITDYQLRWTTGLTVLATIKERFPRCPVVMFTGTGSEEIAVEAMKGGLDDYVLKSPKYFHRLAAAATTALERRREQAAAEELETRYRMLFDSVPIGLFRANRAGLICDANPALVRILGYPDKAALCRMSISDLRLRPNATRRNGSVLEEVGVVRGFETQFERPDGRPVWLRASHRLVRDDQGVVVGVDGSVEDVTDRRRAEDERARYLEQLEASWEELSRRARELREQTVELSEARDEALAATRAKSNFLANVSHELRTPLNGVMGMTELLLDTKLDREQVEYGTTVKRSAAALLDVINGILDFSHIEAGGVTIVAQDFDLRDILEEVATHAAGDAHEKNLDLTCIVPPDFPTRLRGDARRIRQVLANLVGNAIKFTEHGEVTLRAQLEYETVGHAHIRLVVKDTGIGIAKERHGMIFESFTQVDGSSTRRYGGTGLGLTVCRQLTELMGGEMGLQSELGAGSTFWLDVSLQRQPSASQETGLPVVPPGVAGVRVLVADSNLATTTMLHDQLAWWGCRVEVANSAEPAAGLVATGAAAEPFGLAVIASDLGVELPPTLPVVVLSVDRSRALPASGRVPVVLPKPVTQAALLESIVRALGCQIGSRSATDGEAPLNGLRVLVAEDNEINRIVTTRVLQKLGCHPDVVFNGREAVEAFSRNRYDAVLMDLQMPEMDGFEATMEIRRGEHASGRRVPIVAVTAHALPVYRERCLASGMDECVVKPVDPRDLDQVLRRLCTAAAPGQYSGSTRATDDVDPEALLAQVLGEAQDLLSHAETALAAGHAAPAASVWEGLRATCAKAGADGLGLACEEVRLASGAGDLDRAQRALARARDELTRLQVLRERRSRIAPVGPPRVSL